MRFSGKIDNFFEHEIIFLRNINLLFVDIKYFFVQPRIFLKKWFASSCNICLFLSTTDYSLCKITLFCFWHFLFFSCNTKFLFWTFFRKLHHGNIFLLSHSNKNIIKSQKKIYVAHWQHVDFLRSHPRNKEHLFHLFVFTHLLDLRQQLLRAASEKRCS